MGVRQGFEDRAASLPEDSLRLSGVLVQLAKQGRRKSRSFPRKRESTPQTFGDRPSTDWIPAFAGMTAPSKETPSQMTPVPSVAMARGDNR